MPRSFSNKSTKTLWIFCEGETEKRYFQNFQVIERKRQLRIKPKISEDKRADLLVEEAISFKLKKDFEEGDILVCLLDRDFNKKRDLESAKRKAEKENITLFFSNPCFEIWILAHYENCSAFEPKNLYSYMKEKYGLDIKKETSLYRITKDNFEKAVERCDFLTK